MMTENDLEAIEAGLQVTVPQALRDLLLVNLDKYPDFKMERFSGEVIIETAQTFASDGFHGRPWHGHLLPIGKDVEDDFTYFLDLQDSKPWLYSASPTSDPHYEPESYKTDCKFGLIL